MKKTFAAMLIIVLLTMCLTACKNSDDRKASTSNSNGTVSSSNGKGTVFDSNPQIDTSESEDSGLVFELIRDNNVGTYYYAVSGPGTNLDVNLEIPNSYDDLAVAAIGSKAFYDCKYLETVTFPNGLVTIGADAFSGCSNIRSISIPNGVTTIREYAFNKCSGLTKVTIPNSVTQIGAGAFQLCTSLSSIKFNGTVEQWNTIYLDSKWNYNVPAAEIICTDGTVFL